MGKNKMVTMETVFQLIVLLFAIQKLWKLLLRGNYCSHDINFCNARTERGKLVISFCLRVYTYYL